MRYEVIDKQSWNFCFQQEVLVKFNKRYFISHQANNKNLMQCFIDKGYQVMQLASINRCRLYLQVVYLSDITTGGGYHIERSSYLGLKNQCLKSEYQWLFQRKSGKLDWIERRRANNSVFFVGLPVLITHTSYRLHMWDDKYQFSNGTGGTMYAQTQYLTKLQKHWHGNIPLHIDVVEIWIECTSPQLSHNMTSQFATTLYRQ